MVELSNEEVEAIAIKLGSCLTAEMLTRKLIAALESDSVVIKIVVRGKGDEVQTK